jgi:hypothetical protein
LPSQRDRPALGNFGRLAGRPHHDDRLAWLQLGDEAARPAHFEDDHRQQSPIDIDPGAGQGAALHRQRRAVATGGQCLEVLQAEELTRPETPRRRRGLDHDLDDVGGQPLDRVDDGAQIVAHRGRQRLRRDRGRSAMRQDAANHREAAP